MHILSEKLVNAIMEDRNREARRFMEGQKALRLAKEQEQAEQGDQPKKPRWQTFQAFAKQVIANAHLPEEVDYEVENPYPSDIASEETVRHFYERIARGNAMGDVEYLAKKLQGGS